jgi:UDP-glucuronate 4-epimerase
MIRQLEAALGTAAVIDRLPEQSGDVPQTWASIEKARSLLTYEPSTRFDEGIGKFVGWLKTAR